MTISVNEQFGFLIYPLPVQVIAMKDANIRWSVNLLLLQRQRLKPSRTVISIPTIRDIIGASPIVSTS